MLLNLFNRYCSVPQQHLYRDNDDDDDDDDDDNNDDNDDNDDNNDDDNDNDDDDDDDLTQLRNKLCSIVLLQQNQRI